MRFHRPAAPVDGSLLSGLDGNLFTTAERDLFGGDGSPGVAPIPPGVGSRWTISTGGAATINGIWREAENAARVQDIGSVREFALAAGNIRDYIRYRLTGGTGITSCFVLLSRGRFNEPLRLYVEGHSDARAAFIGQMGDAALFYIERRGGGPLAGTRIVANRINSLRFAFRANIGQGKFQAEPPVQADFTAIRATRRGTFSNLAFPVPFNTPRLTLRWQFNNHPIAADAEQVASLLTATTDRDQRGFLLWTGGDEYWHFGGAPERELAWDDVMIERRMAVTHEVGGGAFSGAHVNVGYSGAVEMAETA